MKFFEQGEAILPLRQHDRCAVIMDGPGVCVMRSQYQRRQHVGQQTMASTVTNRTLDLLLTFWSFYRAGHLRRLPAYDLPLALALQERAGVQIVCDFSCGRLRAVSRAWFDSGRDQAKRDDRRVSVLLDANIFGGISGDRVAWLWR